MFYRKKEDTIEGTEHLNNYNLIGLKVFQSDPVLQKSVL